MKYIDTEKVIAAVKRRPLLWERRHDLYKEKDARENAWQEVTHEVMPDYQDLSAVEQHDAAKRIQQRWRTARDTYIKVKFAEESQPPGSRGSKKKYAYYDILSFLDGAGSRVKKRRYEPNDESSCESTVGTAQSPTPSPSTSTPSQGPEKHTKRKKKESKTSNNKTLNKSGELELEKEDLAFFQSLQPTLKRFSNYQKMMFRTKILQIIMDMESPAVNEVDMASSPGPASAYGARIAQHDPMAYTVTVKSEVDPNDDTDDDSDYIAG